MKIGKYLKRTLAALLAVLMLFSAVACGGKEEEETSSATVEGDELFPAKDYGGAEFRLMYRSGSHAYNMIDVYAEGASANVVENQTFIRNAGVEAKYNIKITPLPEQDPEGVLRKNSLSGENICEALADRMYDTFPVISEGLVIPWNDVVDLSNEWWDQNCVEQLKLGGKSYILQGDLTPHSGASYLTFLWFNKTLLSDVGIESPYPDVKNMTWTFEKMYSMIKAVTDDLDGDGAYEAGDRFGMLTQVPYRLITGFDVSFTIMDDTGYPTLKPYDSLTGDKIQKVIDLMKDEKNTISIERMTEGVDLSGFPHIYAAARSSFNKNQLLFLEGVGTFSEEITNGTLKFGVLPMPLYNEDQDRYYNMIDEYACAWVLPYTNDNLEMTGTVFEYMSYSSGDLVDAVYEITLKAKKMQAPEDAEILDIIFDTGLYELAFVGNVGIRSMLEDMVDTGLISSTYKRNQKAINGKYENIRKALEAADQPDAEQAAE